MKILATTSLPAVDRPNANRWNAARSCQKRVYNKEELVETLGLQVTKKFVAPKIGPKMFPEKVAWGNFPGWYFKTSFKTWQTWDKLLLVYRYYFWNRDLCNQDQCCMYKCYWYNCHLVPNFMQLKRIIFRRCSEESCCHPTNLQWQVYHHTTGGRKIWWVYWF